MHGFLFCFVSDEPKKPRAAKATPLNTRRSVVYNAQNAPRETEEKTVGKAIEKKDDFDDDFDMDDVSDIMDAYVENLQP